MTALVDPPIELAAHHAATIRNLRDALSGDDSVLALLLGGSIAHGFATPAADVDYVAVVTAEEYARRKRAGLLTVASRDGCTYDGGYTDGKFVDIAFLERVARSGSEPSRFAFQDARFVIERDVAVRPLLADIVRYPEAGVDDRIERFGAQLLAWRWYLSESVTKQSKYLELLATQKLALFTCRIVLAVNRLLYPYHKWMLAVTDLAPHRPVSLMRDLDRLLHRPDVADVDRLVREVLTWAELDHDALAARWGGFFLADNELTWMSGATAVDDL